MNNHNGGYLEIMTLIIFQAIDVVTVHSISPICKSVDGLSHPSTTTDAVFSTNEQVVVHLWTTDTAAQTEDEGMTWKKSTIVSNGQSNSSSIQP